MHHHWLSIDQRLINGLYCRSKNIRKTYQNVKKTTLVVHQWQHYTDTNIVLMTCCIFGSLTLLNLCLFVLYQSAFWALANPGTNRKMAKHRKENNHLQSKSWFFKVKAAYLDFCVKLELYAFLLQILWSGTMNQFQSPTSVSTVSFQCKCEGN